MSAHAHAAPRERFSLRALFRREQDTGAARQYPAYADADKVTVTAAQDPEVEHLEPLPAPVPHGIATRETLDAIVAEATEQMAAEETQRRETPLGASGDLRQVRVEICGPSDLVPLYRGETFVDIGGHQPRRYVPPGARHPAPPRIRPLRHDARTRLPLYIGAAESASRIGRLPYPPPGATRQQYAAVMRQVSAYTGTRTPFDHPAAWTSAQPGPVEPPVYSWTLQRPPLLALEAGTE